MMRIAVLLVTLLVWLVPCTKVDADAPPTSPTQPDAQLSESEAIRIAEDEARRRNIDLRDFDAPSATYISDGHGGKWHIFFIANSQRDPCFSMDVYRRTERPHFSWCS